MIDIANKLHALKEEKTALEQKLKTLNTEIEGLELHLIEIMEIQNVNKITIGGKTFSIGTRLFASPKAEQKEEVYQWFRENGYDSIVKETINANTLASTVKEMDDEIPSDLKHMLNLYEKKTISIRRG